MMAVSKGSHRTIIKESTAKDQQTVENNTMGGSGESYAADETTD